MRGTSFSYTLIVSNGTQATANGVVVTDPVPSGLTLQGASDVSCSPGLNNAGAYIGCALGTMAPGTSRAITLTFIAPPVPACSQTTVQNVATAVSAGTAPVTSQTVTTSVTCPPPVPQCRDGIDNDADGKIDFPLDPGCMNLDDNDESNVVVALPQCSDGMDNDNDGRVEFFDPGCYPNNVFNPAQYNPNDNDESNAAILCRWKRENNQWVRSCS